MTSHQPLSPASTAPDDCSGRDFSRTEKAGLVVGQGRAPDELKVFNGGSKLHASAQIAGRRCTGHTLQFIQPCLFPTDPGRARPIEAVGAVV
jgi:hypothetical protein